MTEQLDTWEGPGCRADVARTTGVGYRDVDTD